MIAGSLRNDISPTNDRQIKEMQLIDKNNIMESASLQKEESAGNSVKSPTTLELAYTDTMVSATSQQHPTSVLNNTRTNLESQGGNFFKTVEVRSETQNEVSFAETQNE